MALIYAAVKDLFFTAKIDSAAKLAGSRVVFVGNFEDLVNRIEERKPDRVIADLNGFLGIDQIARIKADYGINVVGYLSHVQVDLRRKAEEVCDAVMPQSEFSEKLVDIVSMQL